MITVDDRAFNYGDGCFTTMRVVLGRVEYVDAHLERLRTTCEVLGIKGVDFNKLDKEIAKTALNLSDAVIKVLISRGRGGRGYASHGVTDCHYVISIHDRPAHYEDWQLHGIHVGLSDVRLGHQPLLAGLKHNNRLEQVIIKDRAAKMPYDEVIVCDIDGFMVEASSANVFWKDGNIWNTPDTSLCGVNGIVRQQLLSAFAKNDIQCCIVRAMPSALFSAEYAFICNSLMGIVPIKQFTDADGRVKSMSNEAINPIRALIKPD